MPIPFLRATDISPIALLSENVLGDRQWDNGGNEAVEAIQELFSTDAQSKKGRSRQNEVLVKISLCIILLPYLPSIFKLSLLSSFYLMFCRYPFPQACTRD